MNAVSDRAILFGHQKSMVGILTQRTDYKPNDRPVFVILNTGIIHRVGHHRMYVTLSRALAQAGYQILRFDLSGIGDSESRTDGLPPFEAALADIREAVNWLGTAHQARRIILVGLCSGADHALAYGRDDPRVVGLILLDPSIPPTAKYYGIYFLSNLLRSRSWFDLFSGRGWVWKTVRGIVGNNADTAWEKHRSELKAPEVRAFLQNAYRKTMERETQCLAVFTSGLLHQHNYRRQILDAFPTVPFGDRLRLEYFRQCDHLFTCATDRKRLFDIIMQWAAKTEFTYAPSIKFVVEDSGRSQKSQRQATQHV
jgi:pimeloyl-ACP methyl ester carboxylesterase